MESVAPGRTKSGVVNFINFAAVLETGFAAKAQEFPPSRRAGAEWIGEMVTARLGWRRIEQLETDFRSVGQGFRDGTAESPE